MTATKTTRPTVEELIAQFEVDGKNEALMRQRHQDVVDRVHAYEQKYGMTATEAHQAIERRELQETHEVCKWLIDDASLKPWDDD